MYKPERLAAFCDGVFAIALTLLVLGLETPSLDEVPEQSLTRYLIGSLHAVQGYVSSFLLVGAYWSQHFTIFHYVKRVDRTFIAINGVLLLFISFVPFPTGLQAVYRTDELAMVLYALVQAACGLLLLVIWNYAVGKARLTESLVSAEVVRSMRRRILLTPVVAMAAVALSFVNLQAARILFLAIPLAQLVHTAADAGWLTSKVR